MKDIKEEEEKEESRREFVVLKHICLSSFKIDATNPYSSKADTYTNSVPAHRRARRSVL
jgi:hypothetical protein